MNPHYNQNYTKEQIVDVLETIKDCIRENRYVISKNDNRQENIDFINEYNLTSKKQKQVLLKIKPDDFCHTLQNTNEGKRVVIISFHTRNKPIAYLFR